MMMGTARSTTVVSGGWVGCWLLDWLEGPGRWVGRVHEDSEVIETDHGGNLLAKNILESQLHTEANRWSRSLRGQPTRVHWLPS